MDAFCSYYEVSIFAVGTIKRIIKETEESTIQILTS